MSYGQSLANITAAKPAAGGAVWRAPLGTTLPTDASTALAATFKSLGYINEDGLTHSFAPSSQTIRCWGGEVVYTYSEERPDTYSATFQEALNTDLLKTVYGDENVTVDATSGAKTVKHNNNELTEAVYVIDEVLKDGALKRTVIPNGKVTDVGEVQNVHTGLIEYDLTITAMVDSEGNTSYDYILPAT